MVSLSASDTKSAPLIPNWRHRRQISVSDEKFSVSDVKFGVIDVKWRRLIPNDAKWRQMTLKLGIWRRSSSPSVIMTFFILRAWNSFCAPETFSSQGHLQTMPNNSKCSRDISYWHCFPSASKKLYKYFSDTPLETHSLSGSEVTKQLKQIWVVSNEIKFSYINDSNKSIRWSRTRHS